MIKECDVMKCWERPSVCMGETDECAKLDGDGTCTIISDTADGVGNQSDAEYSSIDFGNLFDIGYERTSIEEDCMWYTSPSAVQFWNCSLTSEYFVIILKQLLQHLLYV